MFFSQFSLPTGLWWLPAFRSNGFILLINIEQESLVLFIKSFKSFCKQPFSIKLILGKNVSSTVVSSSELEKCRYHWYCEIFRSTNVKSTRGKLTICHSVEVDSWLPHFFLIYLACAKRLFFCVQCWQIQLLTQPSIFVFCSQLRSFWGIYHSMHPNNIY